MLVYNVQVNDCRRAPKGIRVGFHSGIAMGISLHTQHWFRFPCFIREEDQPFRESATFSAKLRSGLQIIVLLLGRWTERLG